MTNQSIIETTETEEVKLHFLKTWTEPFEAVADGRKRFEIRKNDKDFKVGDVLILAKYDEFSERIIPGYVCVEVTYFLDGFGVKPGYCVLGFVNSMEPTPRMQNFYLFNLTNHMYGSQDSKSE